MMLLSCMALQLINFVVFENSQSNTSISRPDWTLSRFNGCLNLKRNIALLPHTRADNTYRLMIRYTIILNMTHLTPVNAMPIL
jgi:hypothetical protein